LPPPSTPNQGLARTVVFMVRPGQSEAQQRQEREEEIRVKLSQLKSSGKMKGGTTESIMAEAEEFFNKKSPVRKFEKFVRDRKEAEERQKKEDEGEGSTDDDVV
jgi:hypothetical protein